MNLSSSITMVSVYLERNEISIPVFLFIAIHAEERA